MEHTQIDTQRKSLTLLGWLCIFQLDVMILVTLSDVNDVLVITLVMSLHLNLVSLKRNFFIEYKNCPGC